MDKFLKVCLCVILGCIAVPMVIWVFGLLFGLLVVLFGGIDQYNPLVP